MDDETKKEITAYLLGLPEHVRKMVGDTVWPARVKEITQKYSLGAENGQLLENKVLYVLIGLEPAETLTEDIMHELNISELLATQIENDLEDRVFAYANQFIREDDAEVEIMAEPTQEKPGHHTAPAPDNLPGVDLDSPQEITIGENSDTFSVERINDSRSATGEAVQRPVPVPRYSGQDDSAAPKTIPIIQSMQRPEKRILDAKLSVQPKQTLQAAAGVAAPGQLTTPSKPAYTSDPYREPIQ